MKSINSIKKVLFPEWSFWKEVIGFAIPVALQNLSVSLFGIIDVSIISNMGETAVSAVSLANEVFYVASLVTFGITSGASVLLARYYGAKDAVRVRKVFAVMICICVAVNALVMAASFIMPKSLLNIYTSEMDLIEAGALYLIITAPVYLCYGICNSMSTFFRAIKMPLVPLMVSLGSVILKTLMNVVLIYGAGIIPAMGIAGAAVATLSAKIVEVIIYFCFYIRHKEKEYCCRFKDLFEIRVRDFRIFLKETAPVIINESMWGFGISSFNMIIGRMGVTAVAAYSVACKMENLCNAFFYGIGIGACVIISGMLGTRKYEEARLAAKRFAVVGFEVGIGIMVLMIGWHSVYVDVFFADLTAETCSMAKRLIVIIALYMPFRSLASALIMGVLRAGGDGRHAMCYDVIPVYVWALPIGFLLGIVCKLPVTVVFAAMQFKRVIKCVLALRRMISNKWIEIQEK